MLHISTTKEGNFTPDIIKTESNSQRLHHSEINSGQKIVSIFNPPCKSVAGGRYSTTQTHKYLYDT